MKRTAEPTKKGDMPKIELKLYRCVKCGSEQTISTNHWGECYGRCSGTCGTESTFQPVETPPEGAWIPEPWKKVRLGDVFKIS